MAYSWENRVDFVVRYMYGHEITPDGVRPGEIKTLAVQKYPEPKSEREVRQFLGLTGFFRKFIENYAQLTLPLSILTRKENEFKWEQEQRNAFEKLKQLLSQRPILTLYEPNTDHELHTDACSLGIAGILIQIDKEDIDNNGFLDQKDFECMAVRACVVEGKGDCNQQKLAEYHHIMKSLWEEISELADFDKDGRITTAEFKDAVQKTCVGKKYEDFPQAMKAFIEANFKMIDLNGDGIISKEEYRYNCITRIAVDNIESVDEAFNNLLNDDDRKRGGLTLSRYQELYSHYLGNRDEKHPGVYLFGPMDH